MDEICQFACCMGNLKAAKIFNIANIVLESLLLITTLVFLGILLDDQDHKVSNYLVKYYSNVSLYLKGLSALPRPWGNFLCTFHRCRNHLGHTLDHWLGAPLWFHQTSQSCFDCWHSFRRNCHTWFNCHGYFLFSRRKHNPNNFHSNFDRIEIVDFTNGSWSIARSNAWNQANFYENVWFASMKYKTHFFKSNLHLLAFRFILLEYLLLQKCLEVARM